MARFKIDENLPKEVTELLQQASHDAVTVFDEYLTGAQDLQIAAVCQHEQRCLITLDKDFADIRAYPPAQFSGIIVLRVNQQDKPYVLKLLQVVIEHLQTNSIKQALWIVEEGRIRIKK